MKIRIKGNSLRLRVSQSELQQLRQANGIRDRLRFGPDSALHYALDLADDGDDLHASFDGQHIRISLPTARVQHWLHGDTVSLERTQGSGDETLNLLIEKDFQCLAARTDEDESDLLANPKAKTQDL